MFHHESRDKNTFYYFFPIFSLMHCSNIYLVLVGLNKHHEGVTLATRVVLSLQEFGNEFWSVRNEELKSGVTKKILLRYI
jgi:hypothetical protein